MFETRINDELRLRTFCEDDAETLFRVVDENRAHLREWLPWLDANTTSQDSLAFIQATLRQEADNQGFTCAIEFRGRIVGVAGYHPIRWYNKSVEIGYWLAREAVGHGIMTKCCRVLVSHAFTVYGLNRVQIPAAVGNHRSRAIPERLGFQMEGIIRDAEWLYDHFVDHAMYAMLKKDWNGEQSNGYLVDWGCVKIESIINADGAQISRMLPEDVEHAWDNCALFWEMGSSDDHLRGFLADAHNILLVAEVEGKPVGQLVGYVLQRWDVEKPMLFLFSIDVVESHRRRGIGRQLIQHFQQIGIEAGCGSTFVVTNASNMPAMRMYEALGGTRTNPDDVMFEWGL